MHLSNILGTMTIDTGIVISVFAVGIAGLGLFLSRRDKLNEARQDAKAHELAEAVKKARDSELIEALRGVPQKLESQAIVLANQTEQLTAIANSQESMEQQIKDHCDDDKKQFDKLASAQARIADSVTKAVKRMDSRRKGDGPALASQGGE